METSSIQYARARDGINLAYYTRGSGPPLVCLPVPWVSGLSRELEPSSVRWPVYERWALNFTVVRFDLRGMGLSDASSAPFSLDVCVEDLTAVLDRLGYGRVDVMAQATGSPTALSFAAQHPERLGGLCLWTPSISTSEMDPLFRAIWPLAASNWEAFTELFGVIYSGTQRRDRGWAVRDSLRREFTQESWLSLHGALDGFDPGEVLPRVLAPTLISYFRSDAPWMDANARRLASRLARAEVAAVNGAASALEYTSPDELDAAITTMTAFFERVRVASTETVPPPATPGPNSLRTILFTDLEGHTPMMQRLGDARGREVLREHERLTRAALAEHGGSEVKTMGDGFLASFGSAQRALECAVALQRAFASRAGEPLRVRIGVNAGEPIAEDDDLFGHAVIAASRIASQAQGGQVFVADVVRQLVAGKGFLFGDAGERALKGFEDPVRVWELRWQDER